MIHHDDLESFKGVKELFDNKPIKQLFDSIVETNSIDPLVVQDYLSKKDISVNPSDIQFISSNGQSEDWVAQVYIPWKRELLIKENIRDILKLQLRKDYDAIEEKLGIKVLDMSNENFAEESDKNSTPTIDDKVFDTLPYILKDIFKEFNNKRHRDVVFTATLPVLSILFPNVSILWNGQLDRCNLYSYVGADAGSGKGKMVLAKDLLHEFRESEKRDNDRRKEEVELVNLDKDRGEPKERFIPKYSFIPGNSSSAAFYQMLSNNDGKGLLFVSESDDVAMGKKSDWGNYDNFLRAAFHNEELSRNRMDEEVSFIENPFVSTAMSGTFDQLMTMFDGKAENGLFSRFIFYIFGDDEKWIRKNEDDYDVSAKMKGFSKEILKVFEKYRDNEIRVEITSDLSIYFDDAFEHLYKKYLSVFNNDISSSIKRIAVIARKITIILTMFRNYVEPGNTDLFNMGFDEGIKTGNGTKLIIPAHPNDIKNAISLAKTFLKHTALVYNSFNYNKTDKRITIVKEDKSFQLIEELPVVFTYSQAISLQKKLQVSQRTIIRYLKKGVKTGLLDEIARGKYRKINKNELNEK